MSLHAMPRDKGEGEFATKSEAILAALDEMQEGDTLIVHESHCLLSVTETCSCTTQEWTY
jgi:hypothetical protein